VDSESSLAWPRGLETRLCRFLGDQSKTDVTHRNQGGTEMAAACLQFPLSQQNTNDDELVLRPYEAPEGEAGRHPSSQDARARNAFPRLRRPLVEETGTTPLVASRVKSVSSPRGNNQYAKLLPTLSKAPHVNNLFTTNS
jgi:hypothetical protein